MFGNLSVLSTLTDFTQKSNVHPLWYRLKTRTSDFELVAKTKLDCITLTSINIILQTQDGTVVACSDAVPSPAAHSERSGGCVSLADTRTRAVLQA